MECGKKLPGVEPRERGRSLVAGGRWACWNASRQMSAAVYCTVGQEAKLILSLNHSHVTALLIFHRLALSGGERAQQENASIDLSAFLTQQSERGFD